MIPITFDLIFKSVFSKNLEILKEFLVDILHLDYELEELDIRILNNELPKSKMCEYQKRIDVNIILNDNIYVEIEVNRRDFNLVKYRNQMYEDKIYSMIIESGNNPQKLENIYFYQLNLNTENRTEQQGEHIIVPYDISTNEVYIKNKITILKFLEYYYKLYYNEPKKRTRDVIWLASLSSKTFTEMYEILSEVLSKKELNKFMKDVINMSIEDFNLHEWEKEKFDALIAYNIQKKATEDGLEEGRKRGIKEGRKETLKETVKEMLKNNISIELISKVTKMSNAEIKKIEESIKK